MPEISNILPLVKDYRCQRPDSGIRACGECLWIGGDGFRRSCARRTKAASVHEDAPLVATQEAPGGARTPGCTPFRPSPMGKWVLVSPRGSAPGRETSPFRRLLNLVSIPAEPSDAVPGIPERVPSAVTGGRYASALSSDLVPGDVTTGLLSHTEAGGNCPDQFEYPRILLAGKSQRGKCHRFAD